MPRMWRRSGASRWVLDDWWIGKTKLPSARYLPQIARGLGITVTELLTRANGERSSSSGDFETWVARSVLRGPNVTPRVKPGSLRR